MGRRAGGLRWWRVAACLALLGAATSARAAQGPRLSGLQTRPVEDTFEVDVDLPGDFPQEIRDKIDSGLPVTFTYTLEIQRPRGLLGRSLSRREVAVTVELDSLTRQYRLSLALDGGEAQTSATEKPDEMRRWMTEIRGVRMPPVAGGVPPDALLRARCRLSFGFVLVFFPYAEETPWERVPLRQPEAPHGD